MTMMTFRHMAVSLLALVMSTVVASAYYDFYYDNFYYEYNGDTGNSVTLVDCKRGYVSGSITIPSSVTDYKKTYRVTRIGPAAISSCTGLTSVTIPNTVNSIDEYAFKNCTGLTSVTIPESVTSIGNGAFQNCTVLTSVTVPKSVTSIGNGAFSYCSGLTSIEVSSSNIKYDSRNNCNAIIETKTNTLIGGCKKTTIPNSVTRIGNFAFYGCTDLTSVIIPNSVTGIGNYAFYDCTALKSIYSKIQEPFDIDESVFQYKDGVGFPATIYIPQNTRDLYLACEGWIKSDLEIREMNFINGEKFTQHTSEGIEMTFTVVDQERKTCQVGGAIPNKEGYYYLAVPENATGTVTIPATVTAGYVNDYEVIGIDAIAFKNRSAITKIIIPNSVTYINPRAFLGCTGITSAFIPNSVTSIGAEAFNGCTSLASVDISYKITSIEDGTFAGCTSLTELDIPKNVTTIGKGALPSTLKEVYSFNQNPPSVSSNCLFDNYSNEVYKDKTLYVPIPDNYKSCEPWKYFGQIEMIDGDTIDIISSEVATGAYYFQNVATGQYLTAGNAWGTQASLDDTGIDITIEEWDYDYYLNTKIDNWGSCYLNIDNGAVYCDQPMGRWLFVQKGDGVYALTMNGLNYLAYDGNSTALTLSYSSDDDKAQWRLVTKDERVEAMWDGMYEGTVDLEHPVDATFLLPCANFGRNDTRIGQWEGAPGRSGANTNMNAEKFNTDYDVYQVLEGIPEGWYKVRAQGFYREGADENYQITPAEELRRNGEEHLYAQFYANDVSTPVHSIFDGAGQCDYTGTESEWGYVPNSQADASAYFDKGLYEHEWEVLVTDGTLRIGVRKEAAVYRDWTCFDNFRLFYTGEYHEESQTLAQSITIDQNSLSFTEAGQTAQLTATVLPHNTTDKSVTWKSADWNVATVNANGLVTAVGNGTTEITATTQDGTNLTARCAVTVDIPTVIPETDYTTYVGTTAADWGTDAMVGWAAPAVTTRDGRETALAERYHEPADVTGIVLEQTVMGLPSGVYKAVLYANAYYTPGRNFDSDISDGQLDVVYIFANDSRQYIPVHIGTSVSVHGEYEIEASVPDGTLRLGMMCEKTGTNWHSIQIKSLDRIGGIAAGIETVDNGQWIKDNVVYDLQGRKINNNAKKGLYIINGKKVVK